VFAPHAVATVNVPLEAQPNVDYSDPALLSALAKESAVPTEKAIVAASASPPAPLPADNDAATAAACVAKGAGDALTDNDELVRLIDATFAGTPAYLGVYLESPGAGQPPGKVVIWIVSKADCSVLSETYQRI
jgi:hypothetical protein